MLFLVLPLFGLVLSLASCSSPSFPELPKGSYVGSISGIVQGSDRPFTFYAEQRGKEDALLVVILADGWNPQIIDPKQKGEKAPPTRELVLTREGVKYRLTGTESSGSFSGSVAASDGRQGKWTLTPIDSASLREKPAFKLAGFDLADWLTSKVRYNIVHDEIESLALSHEQDSAKAEKLDRFVKNENVLKDRSQSRKDALTTELNRITEQRKKNTEELRGALNDIALLHRMTKEGQIVELNRRIQRRENKWYSINWSSEGDPASVEEQLAEQAQIDLKKLNIAVHRAEEVERLQNSITDEQQRINQLETALQQKVRTIERTEPGDTDRRPAQPKEAPTDKPWWKVWDNVTG